MSTIKDLIVNPFGLAYRMYKSCDCIFMIAGFITSILLAIALGAATVATHDIILQVLSAGTFLISVVYFLIPFSVLSMASAFKEETFEEGKHNE